LPNSVGFSPTVGRQRRRADRADPRNRHQALRLGILAGDRRDLRVVRRDLVIEVAQLLEQSVERGTKAHAQPVVALLEDLRQATHHRRTPQRDRHAVFQQQPADLINLRDAPRHRQTAHAMDRQHVLLLHRLHRHEPHARALRRLGDRLGISRIVLVGLHERLDALRSDQPHRVPEGAKQTRPVVGTAARLHRDRAGRQLSREWAHLLAAQLLAEHHPPLRVHTSHVNAILGEVDAHQRDDPLFALLAHWSAL
jgi:hypothetical protein